MSKSLLCLALLAAWPLASGFRCVAQLRDMTDSKPRGPTGSITGSVVTSNNQPLQNTWVQLQGVVSGKITSTYTDTDGSFEFPDLPDGDYLVLARSQQDEASEQVHVRFGQIWVTLKMPLRAALRGNGQTTVSASQLQVPDKARGELQKAQEAIDKGKLANAARSIEKALSIYPHYPEALTLRAAFELQDRHLDQALVDADLATQYDPTYGQAYFVLGATYGSLRQFDQAIRILDRGIATAPNPWMGYFEMGKVLVAKGEFAAALHQADKASRLVPRNFPPIHLLKAEAYVGLKDHATAITELQAYLKAEPAGPSAQLARQRIEQLRAATVQER
jgi:tetratricopeptide (TPR) repeat protein